MTGSSLELKALEAYKTFFQKYYELQRTQHQTEFLDSVEEKVVTNWMAQGEYLLNIGTGPIWEEERSMTKTPTQKCEQMRSRFSFVQGERSIAAAECNALFIHTQNFEEGFFEETEELSREAGLMARALCDDGGRLRREVWKTSNNERAEPVFEAIEHTNLLLFEFLHVAPRCRRLGIGKVLIEAMMARAIEREQRFVAIVRPEGFEEGDIERKGVRDIDPERFFRSMGFCKIGKSEYWAFSPSLVNIDRKPAISN